MANQFRKLNKPTFLDNLWNFSRKCLYLKLRPNIFFELGSYLYRFKKNIFIEDGVYIKINAILGCANSKSNLSIGSNTTIGFGTIAISSSSITIGKNCMIAPYVHMVDSNHGSTTMELRRSRKYHKRYNYW